MALNLLKLCVGADSLEDQIEWSERRLASQRSAGEEPRLFHVTRMVPKQREALLAGGSLYWVIKGNVQARQRLVDIEPFVSDDGIRRCRLILGDEIVPTRWQPRRAFQGWRYLKAEDAPPDLASDASPIPPVLQARLAELGLL